MMNFLKGFREAPRRMSEMSAAWDGAPAALDAVGILYGTRIASNLGWRPVEALTVGDEVFTFDGGMQAIRNVRRRVLWDGMGDCPRALWPVAIAAGTCEISRDALVLPAQPIMVESDAAEDVTGDPFALVRAGLLAGLDGVVRARPYMPIEVVELFFDGDQVVHAEGGLLMFCPAQSNGLTALDGPYDLMPRASAEEVIAAMAVTPTPIHA